MVRLAFAYDRAAASFSATVTVPGNTAAHTCLPRYLFADTDTRPVCSLTLGGRAAAAEERGGLLCLEDDLGGGQHEVVMKCA